MGTLALSLVLVLARPASASAPSDRSVDPEASRLREDAVTPQTMACLVLSDADCAAGADATRLITRESRNVPLAPAVFGDPAVFQRLVDAYHHGTVEDVKATLGRSKEDWITNTCAIRLSFALNYSGVEGFPVDRSLVGESKKINFITNKNDPQKGFAYIYRVDEFANYMLKKYGKPQVWARRQDNPRAAVWGKKGIILFVVKGWDDATGHFDLWDGQKAAHQEYFDQSSDVFLWQ